MTEREVFQRISDFNAQLIELNRKKAATLFKNDFIYQLKKMIAKVT